MPENSLAKLEEEIRKAAAAGQTSFNLTHEYEFTDGDVAINIPENMTINGNGHKIDGKGHEGIFNITNKNVTLNHMTIENVNGTAVNVVAYNFKAEGFTLNNNTGTGINVNGNNSDIENVVANNNAGTVIAVDGNNNDIENVVANNQTGSVIAARGNENKIINTTANDGNTTIVDIVKGNNNLVDNVIMKGNFTGDCLKDNGTNTTAKGISPGNADTAFDLSKANANPSVYSIKVPEDATGNFTVSIGGQNHTAKVVNGTATVTVDNLPEGSYPVLLTYTDNSKYSPLYKTATVKVPAPQPTTEDTMIVAKNKITFKKNKRNKNKKIAVTLKTKAGKVLAAQKVYFKLDKKILKKIKAKGKGKKAKKLLKNLKKGKYSVTTKANGKATLKLKKSMFKFKKGKGKLIASFKGSGNYKASSKAVKIVMK